MFTDEKILLISFEVFEIFFYPCSDTQKIWDINKQHAWTYCNLKQQWAYVTQTISQMKKGLDMVSILR